VSTVEFCLRSRQELSEIELANAAKSWPTVRAEVFGQQQLVVVIQSERLRSTIAGFTMALAQALQELAACRLLWRRGGGAPTGSDPGRIARLLAREHLAEVVKVAEQEKTGGCGSAMR